MERKYIEITNKQVEEIEATGTRVRMQKLIFKAINMNLDTKHREPINDATPKAMWNTMLFLDMGIDPETLIYNSDTYKLYMYTKRGGYIEGAFIDSNICKILDIEAMAPYRGEGVGSKILKLFMEQVQSKFKVYQFCVTPKDPLQPFEMFEGQYDKENQRIMSFFRRAGFKYATLGEMYIHCSDEPAETKTLKRTIKGLNTYLFLDNFKKAEPL
jgi:GNAT superfamily N-acetyltransferase